jgi:hypothetical protein
MPSPIEEIALRDLVRHPKLVILYAVFLGVGWLGNRIIPSQEEKDKESWKQMYYKVDAKRDSTQRDYDRLLIEFYKQHQTIKTIDSLVTPLGKKATPILKHSSHDH